MIDIIDPRQPGFVIPEAIVIALHRPLQLEGRTLAELSFKVPTFAELKKSALADDDYKNRRAAAMSRTKGPRPLVEDGREGALLAALSNDKLKEQDFDGLAQIDVERAMEEVFPFLNLPDLEEDIAARQRSDDFLIPDQVTHTLLRPFEKAATGGEKISAVTFRPPTYAETKKFRARLDRDGNIIGTEFMMMSLSDDNLGLVDLGRMLALDFQLVGEKLAPFLALKER